MSDTLWLRKGRGPVLVSVPHAGTDVPADLLRRLSRPARERVDTDWWVDRVWQDALEAGAGMLVARVSRYVIDLNRPPDNAPLYDAAGTGLVPCVTFDGEALYTGGERPDQEEVNERLERYWRPYHKALAGELIRLRKLHGYAILLDAHSIRSEVPRLFEGRLPDLNLGSNSGASAAPGLVQAAYRQLQSWSGHSRVLDGRFRGGYITRHYGDPEHGVHALQMEMAQSVYMREDPPRECPDRLDNARKHARGFLDCLMAWEPVDG